MLPDSGHIQEMESEWKNKKRIRQGKEPLVPMYTAEDALNSLEVFKPVDYDEVVYTYGEEVKKSDWLLGKIIDTFDEIFKYLESIGYTIR
jgi:hypothetical protein